MKIESINPQLQKTYRRMPTVPFHNPIFLRFVQFISKFALKRKSLFGVAIHDYKLANSGVRVYTPSGTSSGAGLL
jgi:hypothetical protein